MKSLKKLKTSLIAVAMIAAATVATAGSFDNINSNGQSLGKVSKNIAGGFVDATSAFEAFLYVAAAFFITMFILSMVKYKKSDGREGSPGLIAMYLVGSVCCVAAPTLMGGGLTTLFGQGNVTTIKAPQANIVGN